MKAVFTTVCMLLFCVPAVRAEVPAENSLVGRPAPDWRVADWINSEPLTLDDLKGKVILVRWWTAPDCPFCTASAPALNEFYQDYHDRGLEVIGFYHHKLRTPLVKSWVAEQAQELGFEFPLAVDHQWRTLRQWWLRDSSRRWTSVSFLVDKKGIIRYVHSGGKYVKGGSGYQTLRRKIEMLLEE